MWCESPRCSTINIATSIMKIENPSTRQYLVKKVVYQHYSKKRETIIKSKTDQNISNELNMYIYTSEENGKLEFGFDEMTMLKITK